MLAEPRPLTPIGFEDGSGHPLDLTAFRGRVVLLNLWATWCAPCRTEMPALDRLEAWVGGADFEVIALSIDRGGADTVQNFYREVGVTRLGTYVDPSGDVVAALGAAGLPTTLVIDRGGRELGRVIGPAEWDSPEWTARVTTLIRTGRLDGRRNGGDA
ncbi:TlpA family protein disulfide reductase [Marinivivus vitaminiproducens]|uniref:TlpA family protein disulfide reductase n=1 Tax=Marinivivus vitaminiproducens TaxID=3035935 RepID=UPI0027A14023|nr:TlpA disulfide reductase family protein [Geminicoccaceae bacterium SCSIO 64248]